MQKGARRAPAAPAARTRSPPRRGGASVLRRLTSFQACSKRAGLLRAVGSGRAARSRAALLFRLRGGLGRPKRPFTHHVARNGAPRRPVRPEGPRLLPVPQVPEAAGQHEGADARGAPLFPRSPYRPLPRRRRRRLARGSTQEYRTQPFEARGAQDRAHRQVRSSLLFVAKFTVRRANSRQPL